MASKSELICLIEQYRSFVQEMRKSGEPLVISEKMLTTWIFHESMIEGRRFETQEIQTTLKHEDKKHPVYMKLVFDEIRALQKGIESVVQWSQQGNSVLSLSRFKALHKIISATDAEAGTFRKNSPVHRDYQQEICNHLKVQPMLKDFLDELNQKVEANPYDLVNIVVDAHMQLMHIYPFRRLPGSVIRLFCNLVLLANDYPPIIITAQEKGEYYAAIAEGKTYQIHQVFKKSIERFLSLNEDFLLTTSKAQLVQAN
jgi:Fic family protein